MKYHQTIIDTHPPQCTHFGFNGIFTQVKKKNSSMWKFSGENHPGDVWGVFSDGYFNPKTGRSKQALVRYGGAELINPKRSVGSLLDPKYRFILTVPENIRKISQQFIASCYVVYKVIPCLYS